MFKEETGQGSTWANFLSDAHLGAGRKPGLFLVPSRRPSVVITSGHYFPLVEFPALFSFLKSLNSNHISGNEAGAKPLVNLKVGRLREAKLCKTVSYHGRTLACFSHDLCGTSFTGLFSRKPSDQ